MCVPLQCLESILSKSPSPGHGLSWLVETIKSPEHAPALRGKVCHTLVQVRGDDEGRGGAGGGGVSSQSEWLLFLQASAAVMDVALFQSLLLAITELTTEQEALETVEVIVM